VIDTALPDLAATVTPMTGASRRGRGHHTGQDLVVDGGMGVVPAR
jgi:hypothetical protein